MTAERTRPGALVRRVVRPLGAPFLVGLLVVVAAAGIDFVAEPIGECDAHVELQFLGGTDDADCGNLTSGDLETSLLRDSVFAFGYAAVMLLVLGPGPVRACPGGPRDGPVAS